MTEWVKTPLGEIGHVVTGFKTAPTFSNPENYGEPTVCHLLRLTDMDGRRYR